MDTELGISQAPIIAGTKIEEVCTGFIVASCHSLLLAHDGPELLYLLQQSDIKSVSSLHAPLMTEPK